MEQFREDDQNYDGVMEAIAEAQEAELECRGEVTEENEGATESAAETNHVSIH